MSWVVLGVYLLGWLLAVRPAMRRRMLRKVCNSCGMDWACGHGTITNPYISRDYVVRGAEFDRDGFDVAASVWLAFWWPVWLTIATFVRLVKLLGGGIKTAVDRVTPLTAPELERRLREQQETIQRLSAEIARDSR